MGEINAQHRQITMHWQRVLKTAKGSFAIRAWGRRPSVANLGGVVQQ
jgi:hypothetical protein